VGIKVGCSVGECDGLWLGLSMIGCAVGRRVVGTSCGCPVGSIVGISVSSADGDKEGCWHAFVVGPNVFTAKLFFINVRVY